MTMKLSREDWESLKKEMADLKVKVSTMAKSQTKEMRALKLENLQLSDKVDELEEELLETKRLLKIEMTKSSSFRQTVEHLKKVFNRTLVSGHETNHQALTLPTPPTPSSLSLTLTPSPAPVKSPSPLGASAMVPRVKQLSKKEPAPVTSPSTLGASAMVPRVKQLSKKEPAPVTSPSTLGASAMVPRVKQLSKKEPAPVTSPSTLGASAMVPRVKQLSEEEIKSLRITSYFGVRTDTSRRVQAGATMRLDGYVGVYHKNNDCVDMGTGVYTTPVRRRYRFMGAKYVVGEGHVKLYMCGGDGRREKMAGGGVLDGYDGWLFDFVEWDCPKGLTVWMEVEGGRGRGDIEFTAMFVGVFID